MITPEKLVQVFKDYLDPELSIDVWTLGLIYEHKILNEGKNVFVKLTFTTPTCPFGPQMVEDIEQQIKIAGAQEVEVVVTFDPPWKPSEELREMLGV